MLILQLCCIYAAMIKYSPDKEDVGKFAPRSPAVYRAVLRQRFHWHQRAFLIRLGRANLAPANVSRPQPNVSRKYAVQRAWQMHEIEADLWNELSRSEVNLFFNGGFFFFPALEIRHLKKTKSIASKGKWRFFERQINVTDARVVLSCMTQFNRVWRALPAIKTAVHSRTDGEVPAS